MRNCNQLIGRFSLTRSSWWLFLCWFTCKLINYTIVSALMNFFVCSDNKQFSPKVFFPCTCEVIKRWKAPASLRPNWTTDRQRCRNSRQRLHREGLMDGQIDGGMSHGEGWRDEAMRHEGKCDMPSSGLLYYHFTA